MGDQKQISRSVFFRVTAGLCLGFIGWSWLRISGFQIEKESRTIFRHGNDIPMGISYFDKYYLYRSVESLRAFSTTCTHAGCRIGKSHGDVLQCSCHGSQFDGPTGRPVRGPAFKPLKELACHYDKQSDQWIVSFHKTDSGKL
jgi:Rieske Fe-S protein